MRRPATLGLPIAFSALLLMSVGQDSTPAQPTGPVLVPHLVRDLSVLRPAAAQLLVASRAPAGQPLELLELELVADGVLLERRALDRTLAGDPDFVELNALRERLPQALVHRHGPEQRYFADPDASELSGEEARAGLERYRGQLAELGARYADPAARPFAPLDHDLPYDQLFHPDDAPGSRARLVWTLVWRVPGGLPRRSSVAAEVRWHGRRPGLPDSFQQGSQGTSLHVGDLHVHSCHGEALGACSPSSNCAAETFQTSGSFTYGQLKGQYQALGMDWFTASDHSYCINSDAEYASIVAECASETDAGFVVIPDIELSSDEEGAQEGSDLGDLLCLGLTSANHMGAHGISSRCVGGGDGVLGFCGGLNGFKSNVAKIRAQGGYPIVNHPAATSFGWNSRVETVGQEADGLHGVEIWNGPLQTGQAGHVADWVDWLLGGRVLYAYSGSDTHDAAFAFGANHALVEGPFTPDALEQALRAGRVYVSNGPSLVLELELGGSIVPMGAQHTLPTPVPAAPLTVRAHVDWGADQGRVSLYRGRVGDASETLISQSGVLAGSFAWEVQDVLAPGRTWYRAYLENQAGTRAAYSNPVFLHEGSGDIFTYCTGKENSAGCTPSIGATGTPSASAGSGFLVSADHVLNQSFGILVYGYQPAFTPFDDGTLCIGPPLVRTGVQHSGGSGSGADCTGGFSFDFNLWIASGQDPGLTAGTAVYAQHWYRDPSVASTTGLSDAIQFTIQP